MIEKLQSAGLPNGFTLVRPDGTILDFIYRVDIKGNKVVLRTALPVDEKHKLNLHYGYTDNNIIVPFAPYHGQL